VPVDISKVRQSHVQTQNQGRSKGNVYYEICGNKQKGGAELATFGANGRLDMLAKRPKPLSSFDKNCLSLQLVALRRLKAEYGRPLNEQCQQQKQKRVVKCTDPGSGPFFVGDLKNERGLPLAFCNS
jgi:hypothetical protein